VTGRWTIQRKLLALILLPLLCITAVLVVYFPAMQLSTLQANLDQKALTYGRLVSKEMRSAVAFDDRETAREVFEALAQDADVSGIVLFTARGDVLQQYGSVGNAGMAARNGVRDIRVFPLAESVLVVAPVNALEGARGSLAIELSTQSLAKSRSQVRGAALAIGLCAVLAGALAAFLIARSFARRLRALAAVAASVAGGDLEQRLPADASGDEIGVLGFGLKAMLDRLRGLIRQIQDSAREEQARLERMVALRTHELHSRNDDMRLVLNTMGQGFLTVDVEGRMAAERSAILDTWLGPAEPGTTLWDYIGRVAPQSQSAFQYGYAQAVAGIFPLEVSLGQMPARFVADGRTFSLDYHPINREGDQFEQMLVVISDISARVERERAEADEREMGQIFAHVMRDRAGFLEFFAEARGLCDVLASPSAHSAQALVRAAHTLKGNAATFGMTSIATLCHELEDHMQREGEPSAELSARLLERFGELADKLRALVGECQADTLEVYDEEYCEVLNAIRDGASHELISAMIEAWKLEPMGRRFERIGRQLHALNRRLRKGELVVVSEPNRVRLDADGFSEFWSAFNHALRNAVDHGLEDPELRVRNGKPAAGTVKLRASLDGEELALQIEDDGRGIDWNAVRERATQRGLPSTSHEHLVDALFADGLSTKAEATDVSGRGVGLGALRAACLRLGGRVAVDSELGRFTRFTFRWPAALVPSTRPVSSPMSVRPLAAVGLETRCSIPPRPAPSL
jgi:two-component system chemotaxis sensor kinase CheA